MLARVTLIEINRAAECGRTNPLFVTCEKADGSTLEAVAKFSAACDLKEASLAMEVIGACLASDLGLPVPEPLLIDVPPQLVELIPDAARRDTVRMSSPVAFGSKVITGGYSAWSAGTKISESMLPFAAAIFAFDGMIQNPDRRVSNPNCLVKGDEIRIIDHEACFFVRGIIGWVPPWRLGGLRSLETPGNHIFLDELKGRAIEFGAMRDAWSDLSDERIKEYESAVPGEWDVAGPAVKDALSLIRGVRDQIDGCLAEVKRVLT